MTQDRHEHHSVLLVEALAGLEIQAGQWYVDATFGRGGHTSAIIAEDGNVVAIDCDQTAIEYGTEQFADEIKTGRLILVKENFDRLETAWKSAQRQYEERGTGSLGKPAGILFDFGVSSPQLGQAERGFSFQQDGPLDMRMDRSLGVTAADLVAVLPEKQLSQIFREFGGEKADRKLAKAIVSARTNGPITTTRELAELIESVHPRRGHLHPATKVFQALRIAVNTELESITAALPQALSLISDGGRVVTISFHEGEDALVKRAFQRWEQQQLGQVISKHAIVPTTDEVAENTRSRSAKLRIFEKKTQPL